MRPWFLLALFIPVEAAASGSLVVLGSTVELPAPAVAAPPVERCRERPRLLTPMLVGYAGLQAADAHSTLRALDAGAVEANPSPPAQWTVRTAPRAYGVKTGVTVGSWWRSTGSPGRTPGQRSGRSRRSGSSFATRRPTSASGSSTSSTS